VKVLHVEYTASVPDDLGGYSKIVTGIEDAAGALHSRLTELTGGSVTMRTRVVAPR